MTVTLSATDTPDLQALVRAVVWQVCGRDDDDLAQDAWVAILPLVGRYDPGLGVPLRGFVHRRCRGAVLDALRLRTGSRNRHRRVQVPLFDNIVGVWDATPIDDRDELERALARMTQRERSVLVAFHGGVPQEQIAARLGVTQSRVSQIIGEACKAGRR